jgi:hypothetical protein
LSGVTASSTKIDIECIQRRIRRTGEHWWALTALRGLTARATALAGIVAGEMTVQGVEANDAIMTAWGSIVDCPPVDNNYLVASSGGRGERGGRREEGRGTATMGSLQQRGEGVGEG